MTLTSRATQTGMASSLKSNGASILGEVAWTTRECVVHVLSPQWPTISETQRS